MSIRYDIIEIEGGYEVRQTNTFLNGNTQTKTVARYAGFDDAVSDVYHRQPGAKAGAR